MIFVVGIRPDVHPMTETIDIEACTGQPVFERGKVLEEHFFHQRLVPIPLVGDMGWEIDAIRPGD